MLSCFGSLSQKHVVSTRFTHLENQQEQTLEQSDSAEIGKNRL